MFLYPEVVILCLLVIIPIMVTLVTLGMCVFMTIVVFMRLILVTLVDKIHMTIHGIMLPYTVMTRLWILVILTMIYMSLTLGICTFIPILVFLGYILVMILREKNKVITWGVMSPSLVM